MRTEVPYKAFAVSGPRSVSAEFRQAPSSYGVRQLTGSASYVPLCGSAYEAHGRQGCPSGCSRVLYILMRSGVVRNLATTTSSSMTSLKFVFWVTSFISESPVVKLTTAMVSAAPLSPPSEPISLSWAQDLYQSHQVVLATLADMEGRHMLFFALCLINMSAVFWLAVLFWAGKEEYRRRQCVCECRCGAEEEKRA